MAQVEKPPGETVPDIQPILKEGDNSFLAAEDADIRASTSGKDDGMSCSIGSPMKPSQLFLATEKQNLAHHTKSKPGENEENSTKDQGSLPSQNLNSAFVPIELEKIQRRFSGDAPNHHRNFPLLKIDLEDEDDDDDMSSIRPESTVSALTVHSLVTETARATTVFSDTSITTEHNDGRAYTLTFHNPRIGLQFQKVPAFSSRPRGALAEAMAGDFPDDATSQSEDTLDVVRPVDAVLVCGFQGFDTNSGPCPKLGARLIAFDNVSIERGRWTFEAVGKAIKARGRPITMTFRNDYLNSEQRGILYRAVNENGQVASLPQHHIRQRNGTTTKNHLLTVENDYSSTRHFATSTQGATAAATAAASEAGSVLSSAVGPLLTSLLGGLAKDTKNQPLATTATTTPRYMSSKPEYVDDNSNHRSYQADLL
mmetsp:Transcript_18711/g.42724  ORF Transcript_18711/g.42724 Transcript_18711/m.42724 type:complete len:426 (+) Transcript_18711:1419-2696(+)